MGGSEEARKGGREEGKREEGRKGKQVLDTMNVFIDSLVQDLNMGDENLNLEGITPQIENFHGQSAGRMQAREPWIGIRDTNQAAADPSETPRETRLPESVPAVKLCPEEWHCPVPSLCFQRLVFILRTAATESTCPL